MAASSTDESPTPNVTPSMNTQKPKDKSKSPRFPSLFRFPVVQSPILPNIQFAIPVISVSAATPPGLTRPFTNPFRSDLSQATSSPPPLSESSPTMTLQVEPQPRARSKDDEIAESSTSTANGTVPLTKVKNRAIPESGTRAIETDSVKVQVQETRPPLSFGGMASFGGGRGWDW